MVKSSNRNRNKKVKQVIHVGVMPVAPIVINNDAKNANDAVQAHNNQPDASVAIQPKII